MPKIIFVKEPIDLITEQLDEIEQEQLLQEVEL